MNQSQSHSPNSTKVMQEVHHHTAQGGSFEPDGYDDFIDFPKLFWCVVRYSWLIAAFLVIGTILGALISAAQTPLYRSTAIVEVQPTAIVEVQPEVVLDFRTAAPVINDRFYEIPMKKMSSMDLLQRVVSELDLANKADFIAPSPTFSLTHMFRKIKGSTVQGQLDSMSLEKRTTLAINRISNDLVIDRKKKSGIISITYSHQVPKYTKAVVNQLAQSFINQSEGEKQATSSLARQLTTKVAKQLIEKQVEQTEKKLLVSEKTLADYARQAGIDTTGSDYIRITDTIANNYKKLTKAIQERQVATRTLQLIDNENFSTFSEWTDLAAIQAIKLQSADLRAVYKEKLSTLKPDDPKMVRIQAQIDELDGQVQVKLDAIAISAKDKLDRANEKVQSLRSELSDLERRQSEFPKENFQYSTLQRAVKLLQNQHDNLISRLAEVTLGSEFSSSHTSIISLANEPTSPYSPRASIFVLLAFVISGCIAASIVFIREFFNNTYLEPDQLEQDLNLKILGVMPHAAEKRIMGELEDNNSNISEAYRTLRTSLEFAGTHSNASIVAITSSEPLEGKSSTCLKLARDFATIGKKVLLIDCNMRKPKLHTLLKASNSIGFSNLLTTVDKKKNLDEAYQATPTSNLTFISSGTAPSHPSDILMTQKMELLLEDFKKHYDLVILDCPPVIGLSDAPLITHQADFTLLVVAAGHASKKSIANAMKRLTEAGANVIGIVFTKFQANKFDFDYAYRYLKNNYYPNGTEEKLTSHSADK